MQTHSQTLESNSSSAANDDRVCGVNEHSIYTCSVLRSESSSLLPFSGLRQEYNFSVVPSLPWELFFGKQIKELLLVVNVDSKKTC